MSEKVIPQSKTEEISEEPGPDTPMTEDSSRMIDFIKRFMLERKKEKDPQSQKRLHAISAYEKIKKSA